LKSRNEGICSIALKIRPKNLHSKELENKEKEYLLDKLISIIKDKCDRINYNQTNNQNSNIYKSVSICDVGDGEHFNEKDTVVPFFDIAFVNIFEYVKLEYVDANMQRLHNFFGYKAD